ncbi:MAG: tRNA(Met) cytidine acetate ligase [Erysipelotrichaceae bacterium]
MKACGIITEYNPFHYGHYHHIQETRKKIESDVLVNVMSGHFVQRGEPAIIDKWQRAEIAIEQGCDLVLELPYIYATQAAEKFALGAIRTLALAKVSDIVFGSESNDVSKLYELATQAIDTEDKSKSLNQLYIQQMGQLKSNDILGISYIKALTGTNIQAHTIQRTNNYQDLHLARIASASAIRKAVFSDLPYTHTTPMQHLTTTHQMKAYYPWIQSLLCTLPNSYLKTLFLMDEGIESHLKKCANQHHTYADFLEAATTKKYSKARIQRTLVQLLNQVSKEEAYALEQTNFIRVLAFNAKGQAYLKSIKDEVTIVTRWKDLPKAHQEMEYKACFTYASVCTPQQRDSLCKREVQPPTRFK